MLLELINVLGGESILHMSKIVMKAQWSMVIICSGCMECSGKAYLEQYLRQCARHGIGEIRVNKHTHCNIGGGYHPHLSRYLHPLPWRYCLQYCNSYVNVYISPKLAPKHRRYLHSSTNLISWESIQKPAKLS